MTSTSHRSSIQRPAAAAKAISPWDAAYRTALANAVIFFVLSAINFALDITATSINVAAAVLFFLGSLWSALKLVRSGGGLAAVSYFVFGAGLFFGFGAAFAVLDPALGQFIVGIPYDVQLRLLPHVNFMNASSVLIVLVAAWPLSKSGAQGRSNLRFDDVIKSLAPLQGPLLVLSFPILFLQTVLFILPESLIAQNFLTQIGNIVYVSIVCSAMQWPRLTLGQRIAATIVFLTASALGLVSVSKMQAVLPIVSALAGLSLQRRYWRLLPVFGLSFVVAYFLVIAPICNNARTHPLLRDDNSIGDRIEIISETWDTRERYQSRYSTPLLLRFAPMPIQAFLMDRYDRGSPGDSLANAGVALVPRVIWRNKPNVTRFGAELDGLYNNRANSQSALAPTYSAEAYWNGGWWALVVVSVLVGLEIGWFTRKWNLFSQFGVKHLGILLFSVRVIVSSVWVENWVVATYVGGFVTSVVLIKAADLLPAVFAEFGGGLGRSSARRGA